MAELASSQLVRGALTLIEIQPLTVQQLEVALLMVEEASEISPDDPEVWRTLFKLAELAERQEFRSRALQQIVRLDPHDDVARLLFVTDRIDRYQTVEERRAAYEKLLDERTRLALGPATASRLAHDYAVLLDRSGDVDGFARWLAEAVALDPSNRNAAATAAGFFRMNAQDAFAEAELLSTMVVSDPTSAEAQTVLAELLLRHGAYVGAARFYNVADRTVRGKREMVPPGLLADRALAEWGAGDTQTALATIQRRQREVDEQYRRALRARNPDITPIEAARIHAPVASTLATVRAAIHQTLGDEQADDTRRAAVGSYQVMVERLAQENAPTEALAGQCLEAAFVVLWLGGDENEAQLLVDKAAELLGEAGLEPAARTRFDAWIALRHNDGARAIELLEPMQDNDPATRLGLALALEAVGRRREAARTLYDLWLDRPGTLIGVWCADRLATMLGQRVVAGEMAERLEELAEAIPSTIDRLPDEPTMGVSMRLLPHQPVFGPYEPIIVNLELTNNAPFPLAIDKAGPISPQIALTVTVQMTGQPQLDELKPFIVDIDRRLRLEAHEQLVIPVDLRRGMLAQVLNRAPLRGATVKVRAVTGFWISRGMVLQPGPMGSEVFSPPIRVDGVRLATDWFSNAISAVIEPDSTDDLVAAAMLCHVVATVTTAREASPLGALEKFGNPRLIASQASAAVTEAFQKLDPVSRSWMLGSIPRSPPLEPLYALAQQDETRLVRLSYLLYCLTGPDDPMIAAAQRSGDEHMARVATTMQTRIAAITGVAPSASNGGTSAADRR